MCFVCHPHFKMSLATEISEKELLILTENLGSAPTNHDLLLTMLVPITGCEMCKTVCENMSKCDRCWKDAQFPVRYCSRDCQLADFPGHKACCGKNLIDPKPMPTRMAVQDLTFALINKWA